MSTPPPAQPCELLGRESINFKNYFPLCFTGTQGENAKTHWKDFEHYYGAYNATLLSDQLTLFRRSIAGDARSWFDFKSFDTLPKLKEEFLRRFSSASTFEDFLRVFTKPSYKEGEDLEAYATTLQEAATEIGISDPDKIKRQFFKGLPTDLRSSAVLMLDRNLKDIVSSLSDVARLGEHKKVTFGSDTVHNLSRPASGLTPRSELRHDLRSEIDNIRTLSNELRANKACTLTSAQPVPKL